MDILELEQTYLRQMADVRDKMHRFGSAKGWSPLRRGRHAHASIFGALHDRFTGVIEAQMDFESHEDWPAQLSDGTPFTFFATASLDAEGQRISLPRSAFCVALTFADLTLRVESLLTQAWDLVSSCTREDLTDGPIQIEQWPPSS